MGVFVFRRVHEGYHGEPAITRERKHFTQNPRVTLQAIVELVMLITLPARRSDRLSQQLDGQNE